MGSQYIICAATHTSGVRHRFAMLSSVKYFADCYGYSVCMLWGVTRGVAYCRFEELLARPKGVAVVNVPEKALTEVTNSVRRGRSVSFERQSLPVFRADRPDPKPRGSFFSWDLRDTSTSTDSG